MFANFELWSGGLLEHPVRPRQVRSNQGCVQCLRVKKKCDEQKPICGRCKDRSPTECLWRSDPSSRRQCSSASATPSAERLQRAIACSPPSQPGTVSLSTPKAHDPLPRTQLPQPLHFNLGSMLALPDLLDIPAGCVSDLVHLGNQVVHGAYFDDRYTLLSFNLPLFADSPPLLHAWLALCAMQAAQLQSNSANSPWLRTALYLHSKAVHGLATHLNCTQGISDWALCAIFLLHGYEKLGDYHKPPCFAHIATARQIFLTRFTSPPESQYQVLQFECLVYRLAVISTFHTTVHTHYECVSELAEMSASSRFADHGLWRHSLWASVPLTMYDTIFKLSFLMRRQPLNAKWTSKLDQLEAGLRSYHKAVDLNLPGENPNRSALLRKQAMSAHDLYTYASLIIAAKLRDTLATSSSATVQEAFLPGLCTLQHLAETNFLSPVFLWPVSILGIAAQTPVDRLSIRNYIMRLAPNTGLKATRSVLRLLNHAWQPDHGMMGLDILFNDKLLSHVFL